MTKAHGFFFGATVLALCVACNPGSTSDAGSSSVDAGSDGGDSGTVADSGSPPATWTFSGGTVTASFTAGTTPSAVSIPAGGDVSASVALQFAAPASSGALTLSTAQNACCGMTTPDVSPATLPPDNANSSGIPGSVPNHPILYLSFYNPGASALSFGAATPAIVITPTSGGTLAMELSADAECQLDFPYESQTSSWTLVPGARVMLSPGATSFSIPSAALPSGGLVFKPGQTLGAISCD